MADTPTNSSDEQGNEPAWVLTEVKDGVQVAVHQLLDPVTVLGRAEEDVDVILAHPSCSRRHATIQLRPKLCITDSSTHGTFVDRTKVAPGMTTRLNAGSIIQFGASTRLYFIEEQPRGMATTELFRQEEVLEPCEPSKNEALAKEVDHSDVAPTVGDSVSLEVLWRDESRVPPKLQKEWERYKGNKHKLENIRQESERIQVKGDLTVGQERHLERNREREEQLVLAIQQAEEALLKTLQADKAVNTEKETHRCDDEDEDDEVDDRTKQKETFKPSEVETEASLTSKFKSILKLMEERERIWAKAKDQYEKTSERFQLLQNSGDEEEAFFAQNDLDLAFETLEKETSERRRLEDSLNETMRHLKLANPKLTIDPVTGYVGGELPCKTGQTLSVNAEPHGKTELLMPPPARKHSNSDRMMPPPKRSRLEQPPLQQQGVKEEKSSPANYSAPQTSIGPSRSSLPLTGTAATLKLLHVNSGGLQKRSSSEAVGPALSAASDARTDTWRAPKDQDGSGRTKLNLKFAGRY